MMPEIIAEQAFGFLLIFTRIGTMLIIMPALGATSIPARVRLVLALIISLMIFNFLKNEIPAMPTHPMELGVMIVMEFIKGFLIGMIARMIVLSLHVTGTIVGFQSGMAAAQMFDPNQGAQGAVISAFLSILAVVIIFLADLHHLLIRSMVSSYSLFPITSPIIWGDFAEVGVTMVSQSFLLGVQLSTPFIVYALVFYISLGLVARLMPQLPVFFIAMPLNVFTAILILGLVISSMMMMFAGYFENQITQTLEPV